MSNRHLARSIVLQSLFEWDFNNESINIDNILEYDIDSFAPSLSFKDDFLQFLSKGVTRHIKKIDKIIKTYAPEWPINQISVIDKNILRIAIFELVYSSTTPYKVVINEAVELAKNFSGNKSSKFINGVLGSVVSEINKNTTKIYDIGFIIKNLDNSYLVINKDNKFKFFRINNNIKSETEKINDEEFEKEIIMEKKKEKEEKEKKEEGLPKLETNNKDIKEDIIESDEIEQKEDLDAKDNDKKDIENYINFASKEFEKLFKVSKFDIKPIDNVSYSLIEEDDKKALFPKIILKNIFFVFIELLDNNISLNKLGDEKNEWISQEKMLSSMEYKNIKNILNKIIQK